MEQKQLEKIISAYGTPLHVLEEGALRERVSYLRSSLPPEVQLCYAVKANTFIMAAIRGLVDCYEVCSPGELQICQEQKLPPEQLVISGVYKTPEVMEELIGTGAPIRSYTVESMEQFRLLGRLAQQQSCHIRLLLRLTSGNQFGLEEGEIREILRESAGSPWLDIRGIQYFSGTQKTSLKRLKRELEYVDAFLEELWEQTGTPLQELEFGPGFPVSYFQSEEWEEAAYLEGFCQLLRSMKCKPRITLELGRSIAACCGSYLTRVVDQKTNKGQNYAIVDGGIHQLVYYGQSMAMKHPLYEIYRQRNGGAEEITEQAGSAGDGPGQGSSACELWNLCGSLCTVNDILVKQLPLRDLQIGDVVRFCNTGAYCLTEGMALFLSRELPRVIMSHEDGSVTVLREQIQTSRFNGPNHYNYL